MSLGAPEIIIIILIIVVLFGVTWAFKNKKVKGPAGASAPSQTKTEEKKF